MLLAMILGVLDNMVYCHCDIRSGHLGKVDQLASDGVIAELTVTNIG